MASSGVKGALKGLSNWESSKTAAAGGGPNNRGISVFDFILRIVGIAVTLGSAIAMGTSHQSLPYFNRFSEYRAKYRDFPEFIFFMVANVVACVYLAFSLVLSVFNIVRSHAINSRILLILLDSVVAVVVAAAGAAAAAIVYLAHQGNGNANWDPFCLPYKSFCQRLSGSLVGSFIGVAVLLLLILLSAVALSRR